MQGLRALAIGLMIPGTASATVMGPGFAEAGYTLVYDLSIPGAADYRTTAPAYATDISAAVPAGGFDRVGYYISLSNSRGAVQWVSVSMSAFTGNAAALGVPTAASGEIWQQAVSNMDVYSNQPGIVTGTGLGGEIQFWPDCYSPTNSTGVPNAGSAYDWGDTRTPVVANKSCSYGAMQIADPAARQMLFSYDGWSYGAQNSDLGVGNESASLPNWTGAHNANLYATADVEVLVRLTQPLLQLPPPPIPSPPSLPAPPNLVAEPGSITMLGTGLGLLLLRRRRRRI